MGGGVGLGEVDAGVWGLSGVEGKEPEKGVATGGQDIGVEDEIAGCVEAKVVKAVGIGGGGGEGVGEGVDEGACGGGGVGVVRECAEGLVNVFFDVAPVVEEDFDAWLGIEEAGGVADENAALDFIGVEAIAGGCEEFFKGGVFFCEGLGEGVDFNEELVAFVLGGIGPEEEGDSGEDGEEKGEDPDNLPAEDAAAVFWTRVVAASAFGERSEFGHGGDEIFGVSGRPLSPAWRDEGGLRGGCVWLGLAEEVAEGNPFFGGWIKTEGFRREVA